MGSVVAAPLKAVEEAKMSPKVICCIKFLSYGPVKPSPGAGMWCGGGGDVVQGGGGGLGGNYNRS